MAMVMPIILLMIPATHNTSPTHDRTFFIVNALIFPAIVIGDGVFDQKRLLSV
jgi:hypothetical protein